MLIVTATVTSLSAFDSALQLLGTSDNVIAFKSCLLLIPKLEETNVMFTATGYEKGCIYALKIYIFTPSPDAKLRFRLSAHFSRTKVLLQTN
jgi:hypothetical protein